MSIVEKAVSRMNSGPEKKHRPGIQPAIGQEARQEPIAPNGGLTRSISNLGLVALGADPVLAKQFRFLKRPILSRVFGPNVSSETAGKLIMITSDLPTVGKSFVILNLAASIAQEQITKVLLIDADPVRRSLTQQLDLEGHPGVLDLLADPGLTLADVMVTTDLHALNFIPAGTIHDNATELFASKRMSEVFTRIDDPDLVILLDSPPQLATSEARALAEKVDHTMIVIEAGRSSHIEIENILRILEQTESTIGLILNKTPILDGSSYKDYYPH